MESGEQRPLLRTGPAFGLGFVGCLKSAAALFSFLFLFFCLSSFPSLLLASFLSFKHVKSILTLGHTKPTSSSGRSRRGRKTCRTGVGEVRREVSGEEIRESELKAEDVRKGPLLSFRIQISTERHPRWDSVLPGAELSTSALQGPLTLQMDGSGRLVHP